MTSLLRRLAPSYGSVSSPSTVQGVHTLEALLNSDKDPDLNDPAACKAYLVTLLAARKSIDVQLAKNDRPSTVITLRARPLSPTLENSFTKTVRSAWSKTSTSVRDLF